MAQPEDVSYYLSEQTVAVPSIGKRIASRLLFPVLIFLSREQSLRLGVTPIDDERVIMALRNVDGKVLDVGCGSNVFVRSYGNGTGVDVFPWGGVDQVVEDAARLPFGDGTYDTVSFLACLNHIPNREKAVQEAARVLRPKGKLLVTMIPPRLGAFIHWLRERHDPDHKQRHIDHADELMGMSSKQIRTILDQAGFDNVRRKPFVFGFNSLYVATKRT